jgi:iron complex outermembrane receptor protein
VRLPEALPRRSPRNPAAVLDPVVVTATRSAERAFDVPAAIDVINAQQIQRNQLQINLSESLARVAWHVDPESLELRAGPDAFDPRFRRAGELRGARRAPLPGLHPVTMPDGQGQTSSFSLVSAQRIEVLRGPFSSLYGNSSGGVISVFTEEGPTPPQVSLQAIGGSFGTSNLVAKIGGQTDFVNFDIAGNRFETDGYRDHSEARRELLNAKLTSSRDRTRRSR